MRSAAKPKRIVLTVAIIIAITAVAAILVILTVAQQKADQSGQLNLTAEEVLEGVINKMNYRSLSQISSENISKYYEIPDGTIVDFAMYVSGKADSSTEIACFKLKDKSRQETLITSINNYLASKSNTYKDVADSAIHFDTDVSYPYVFVAVSSDSQNAVSAFEFVISHGTEPSLPSPQ